MKPIALEICVDTADGILTAAQAGADRIELCAALSEGGLTPSAGLLQAARRVDVPSYVMIRPRCGGFDYSPAEVEAMLADIAAVRAANLAGLVFGAERNGQLDVAVLKRLMRAADGLPVTLHRVIDVVRDPLRTVDLAVDLGFERILTSGQQPSAPAGAKRIAEMVARADGRLSIMPGGGVKPANVAELIAETGVHEVHSSCSVPVPAQLTAGEFDPHGGRKLTDLKTISKMRAALENLSK